MAYNVKFAFGSYANYSNLQNKDAGTIYFITDKPAIYKGATKMTCSDDFNAYIGSAGVGGKMATFLGDYINGNKTLAEVIAEIAASVTALDWEVEAGTPAGADAGDFNVITGFEVVDGKLKANSTTVATLKKIASTGKAEDIALDDDGSLITATNVEDALQEIVGNVNADRLAAKITIEESSGSGDVLKVYDFYQGVLQTDSAAQKTAKKLGTINIPKDYLVKSAEIKTVSSADVPYAGAVVGDKYIDFTINTKDGEGSGTAQHIYIPLNDLVSVIQGSVGAEITVSIGANNTIEASVNKIGATKIIYRAAVPAQGNPGDPDYVPAVAEQTVKAKIDELEDYVGEIPSGATSTDVVSYVTEKVGAVVSTLDADIDVSGTPAKNGTIVMSGVTEVDGVITAVDSVEVEAAGAAAAAEQAAKSYADGLLDALDADLDASGASAGSGVTSASTVNAMSGVTQDDGLLTGVDSVLVDAAGAAAAAESAAKGYADTKIAALDADLDAELAVTDTDANAVAVVSGVTEVDGVITAIDSVAVDAAGAATAAQAAAEAYAAGLIAALDADKDASGTAQYSGTFVMSGVTQVDGKITGVDSVEVEAAGAAAAAESAAKAYTDTALTWTELQASAQQQGE